MPPVCRVIALDAGGSWHPPVVIYLKLAADPDNPEQIKGEYHVTESGLLTVREDGMVPRTYSPHAWISFEDFSDDPPPSLNFGV